MAATIQQEFAFLKSKLTIESKYGSFEVHGNFLGMDFDISQNGQVIGSVSKKWLSWGDTYELSTVSEVDSAFFAALVIAIDNCLHNVSGNSSNS